MDKRSKQSRVNGLKGGRPRGRANNSTIKAVIAQETYRRTILPSIELLIKAQLDLALGTFKEKTVSVAGHKTKVRVYQKEPDGRVIEDILSRVLGKPKDAGFEGIGEGIKELGASIRGILSK